MDHYEIRFLTAEDGEALFSLRRKAYEKKYTSIKDVNALRWNSKLTHTINLGVFASSTLVSAYRIDLLHTVEQARFSLQTNQLPDFLQLPVALGCRACTDPDYENQGLHYILRRQALALVKLCGVQQLVSTFESNNPWVNTLKKMDYTLLENSDGWSDFIPNTSITLLAVLDINKSFEIADQVLKKKLDQKVKFADIEINLDQRIIQNWLDTLAASPMKF